MVIITWDLNINKKIYTWDERLIISLRNQGTQVRHSIERIAKKVHNTINLIENCSIDTNTSVHNRDIGIKCQSYVNYKNNENNHTNSRISICSDTLHTTTNKQSLE